MGLTLLAPSSKDASAPESAVWERGVVISTLVILIVSWGGHILLSFLGLNSERFVLVEGPGAFTTFDPVATSRFWAIVDDIAVTLGTIGVVTVVFDFLNRRSWTRLYEATVERSGVQLGKRVAEDAVNVILGDSKFINSGLSQEQRRTVLERIISASLDPGASELASTTANQLSGERRLSDFVVSYELRDGLPRIGSSPAAAEGSPSHVTISLNMQTPPSPRLEYRFSVRVPPRSPAPTSDDLGVRQWYYEASDEDEAKRFLKDFRMDKLTINGIDIPLEATDTNTLLSAKYIFDTEKVALEPAERYRFTYEMTWPQPVAGTSVSFTPDELCKGLDVLCDHSQSHLKVQVVASLAGPNPDIYRLPASEHTLVGVKTTEWVLPSATVAFVFLNK